MCPGRGPGVGQPQAQVFQDILLAHGPMADPCPVYRPRKPHLSPFYQCVQDHYESLEMLWPERFEKRCAFWRPYLKEVMVRYLACGDLHEGFARIRCETCRSERLLSYSCKRRCLCPCCHQKRAVAFGEWVPSHVLPPVPHRHFVLSIPKILRHFFLRDRRLLADLGRCGWQAIRTVIRAAVPEADPEPGAIVATQSFGDFPERFHPDLHILATDGAFCLSACGHAQAGGKGLFRVASRFPMKALERLFRHKVLRMLLARGKITPEIIEIMDRWRHSGFNVYCGSRILPRQKRSLERLAAYLIRSSFSQERMEYLPHEAQVRYESNITDPDVIRRILEHLGLWLANARPVPGAYSPPPASRGADPIPPPANCPRPTRTSSASSRLRNGIYEAARTLSAATLRASLRPDSVVFRSIRRGSSRKPRVGFLSPGIRIALARSGPKPDPTSWVFFPSPCNSAQCYPLPAVKKVPIRPPSHSTEITREIIAVNGGTSFSVRADVARGEDCRRAAEVCLKSYGIRSFDRSLDRCYCIYR